MMWKLHAIQIAVSITEVLLPIHLCINYGCFCAQKAELISCNKDPTACNWPFTKKACWSLVSMVLDWKHAEIMRVTTTTSSCWGSQTPILRYQAGCLWANPLRSTGDKQGTVKSHVQAKLCTKHPWTLCTFILREKTWSEWWEIWIPWGFQERSPLGTEQREPSYTLGGNVNWLQPLRRTVWRFLKKRKLELSYDPAIPLLGTYPEKTIIQTDTCIQYSLQHHLQ